MNHQTTYRKCLAVIMLLLIFVIDLIAVYELFPNFQQVTLFGAILGVQTLLILAYHQRCMECAGCIKKAGSEIYLFYKVFAVIGCFSVVLILLADIISSENLYLKIIAATTYAALLITGISTAFKAVIGVRNFSGCHEHKYAVSGNELAMLQKEPETFQQQASIREQETLEAWRLEDEERRVKLKKDQQRQKAECEKARLKAKNVGKKGGTFEFPDLFGNTH